ncbi:hypothetical protein OG21DRAFT_1419186, partial [Imleria badia]
RLSKAPCLSPRDLEETIPVALLHPVFGQFLDDCETHSITAEDNAFTEWLANVSSDFYDNAEQRADEVNAVLASYDIGLCVTTHKGTEPEGHQVNGHLSVGEYPCVIAQFRERMVASVSEPYMQTPACYLERTRMQALENTGSPLPCFLLAFFGPCLVFAGAVWNLRSAVQVLTTPLAFFYHPTDTHNQRIVARHMVAFRKAVRSLKQHYQVLAKSPELSLSNTLSYPSLFPYPTSYTSLADNNKKTFRYRERVKDDHKLVFFGTLVEDSGTEVPICIKFVQSYSREAHWHCAQSGFAPMLRGFEQAPGGWFMVVMDELVGFKSLGALTDRLPKSAFEEIRTQLNQLHNSGFVHGDVRDVNIMAKKGTGTTFQLMIIDFDCAGEIDVARYPYFMKRNDMLVDRPDGARNGQPILAAHDHWMLDDIVNKKGT